MLMMIIIGSSKKLGLLNGAVASRMPDMKTRMEM
jgi:hypothetical protein